MEEAICRTDRFTHTTNKGKDANHGQNQEHTNSNEMPFCPLDYSKLKSVNTKCWQGYRRE